MKFTHSLVHKLLFRLSIVALSWFTLLSCSSSPTQSGTSNSSAVIKPPKQLPEKRIPGSIDGFEIYEPNTSNNNQTSETKAHHQNQTDLLSYSGQSDDNSNQGKHNSGYDFNLETKEAFINWVNQDPTGSRLNLIQEYYQYIYSQVGYVPSMEQLLRSARSWLMCGYEPYGIPPKEYWSSMVSTIKLLKYLMKGGYLPKDFELVSVYRNPQLNRCAKGSSKSKHIVNAAVDIKVDYLNEVERESVEEGLCYFWHEQGHLHAMGLGLYKSGTIHIDTQGQRTWGSTYTKRSSKCLKPKYMKKN